MKKIWLIFFITLFTNLSAQKAVSSKPIQKPVLLKAAAKNQNISMEYAEDILFFYKTDLLQQISVMAQTDKIPQCANVANYLKGISGELAFKQKDSLVFKNVGERSLFNVLLQFSAELKKEGLATVYDKKTKQFSQPKTNQQTISMESATEILYYAKTALISFLHKKTENDRVTIYNPVSAYLNSTDKALAFSSTDSSKLNDLAEKNLRRIMLDLAPKLLAEGKIADKVKKTGAFTKQVFVNPCEKNKNRQTITERKGRVIFACE